MGERQDFFQPLAQRVLTLVGEEFFLGLEGGCLTFFFIFFQPQ